MPDSHSKSIAGPLAEILRDSAQIWRGSETAHPKTLPTGFPGLDARLPGGGWPIGNLVEIVPACEGLGELSLCLPLLAALCRDGRRAAFVAPPHIPYAPALQRAGLPLDSILWVDAAREEDARWSAEQLLRDGQTGAVLLWTAVDDERLLRRLQLAAETGRALAFLYRPSSTLRKASPAALRIALHPDGDHTRADLLKVRGGHPGSLTLPLVPILT
jgi:protein ImuA